MPSVSKAQQHLMQAAEHGASFPMAEKLRQSMTHDQLHDFAVGSEKGKPEHVAHHSPPAAYPTSIITGFSGDVQHTNMNTFKSHGMNEMDATKRAIATAGGYSNKKAPYRGQHKNLGHFLHPRKDGKAHGSDCI